MQCPYAFFLPYSYGSWLKNEMLLGNLIKILQRNSKMKWNFLLVASVCILLTSCEKMALLTTPKKQPIPSHTHLAEQAEKNFWDTLHKGQYQNLPETTKLLTAAYLQNPNDPKLAAHLGFVHIWKITERQREKTIEPTITNEIILARKFFSDAVELNPDDARFKGFLGDSILIEGKIFHDEREQVHGYFTLKQAISMWPEFNYFTAGYPMSTLDPHSKEFQTALAWQWKTLDLCAGTTIDKQHPDFTLYMYRETQQGPLRACWNNWIAPHNFEGFFLNMGDMLVKQGDWQTAIQIYNNAKLSKNYSVWPYRHLLEERIAKIKTHSPPPTLLFNSGYGCVVCHQAR